MPLCYLDSYQLINFSFDTDINDPQKNEILLAISLRESGKYEESQSRLTNYLKSNPNDAEAWSLLSQIYLLCKKDIEAEKALLIGLSIDPNLQSLHLNQARLLLKKNKPGDAIIKAESAFQISANDPEIWLVLAACLGANQRDQEALALIEKTLQVRPSYAEAFANRALIRLREKNIFAAIKDLEIAVSIKHHLTELWVLLGTLHYKNNNLVSAIEAIKNAHEIEPTNINYMIDLGELLRQDKKVAEAIIILQKATTYAPENEKAWINLGAAFQQESKISEAIVAYENALVINPNSAEIASNLGAIAKEEENWESAQKYFEKAIVIKPDLAEAHSNLAFTLHELGKLEEAEESFKTAIALKHDFPEAYSNLGNTLKEIGKLTDAEKNYKKAILLNPEYIEGIYNFGILLFEKKHYQEAEELLKKINFKDSQSYLLRCLFFLNKQVEFYNLFDYLVSKGITNSIIGNLGCRAEIKFGIQKLNPFCNNPLSYVLKTNLDKECDFQDTFITPVKKILNNESRRDRSQGLLINGSQSFGNIFIVERDLTTKIKNIIYTELEKYRLYFKDSQEGFIKNWPTEYSLYGWLISMKSGGKLRPHFHEKGWISGSIYINVPTKKKLDSGNLVVCIDDKEYLPNENQSSIKSIDVVTGSLCIFPASLLHYTIPFESTEDRIVLAFDVVPEKQP